MSSGTGVTGRTLTDSGLDMGLKHIPYNYTFDIDIQTQPDDLPGAAAEGSRDCASSLLTMNEALSHYSLDFCTTAAGVEYGLGVVSTGGDRGARGSPGVTGVPGVDRGPG